MSVLPQAAPSTGQRQAAILASSRANSLFADPVAAGLAAPGEIEMQVLFMRGIGTGAEHGGEVFARRLAHRLHGAAMREQGMSYRQIALEIGLHWTRVQQIIGLK